jgi:calcineurin-like phosphoesterase family protein
MRDVDIVWDELLDAFENDDPELIYLLDRLSGEIYLVPADYDNDEFWQEMSSSSDQYLPIPGFDYEQERILLHEFIQKVENVHLKGMLNRAYAGKLPYGKVEEILSFYPEEQERLEVLRESQLAERVSHWLEEHDLFSPLDVI